MADRDTVAVLRWLDAHDPYQQVVLACGHAPIPRVGPRDLGLVWDGCLADAPIGLPAQLLAYGTERVAVVECPERGAGVASRLRSWNAITPDLVCVAEVPGARLRKGQTLVLGQVPVPRRALLGAVASETLDLRADAQDRLRQALELLVQQGRIPPVGLLEEGGAGLALSVSECTSCGVCVRACPESALSLRTVAGPNEQISVLEHLTGRCRGCAACIRLCPLQSVSARGRIPLAEALQGSVVPLAEVVTVRCLRCGALHPSQRSQDGLCELCAFRKENPFGATLPPELRAILPPELAESLGSIARGES